MKWLYLWAGPKMAGTCLQGSLLTQECGLSSWLGTIVPTGPSNQKRASVKIHQPITHSIQDLLHTMALGQVLETWHSATQASCSPGVGHTME